MVGSVAPASASIDDVEDVIADARVALAIEQKGTSDLGLSPELLEALPGFMVAGIHEVVRAGYLRDYQGMVDEVGQDVGQFARTLLPQ